MVSEFKAFFRDILSEYRGSFWKFWIVLYIPLALSEISRQIFVANSFSVGQAPFDLFLRALWLELTTRPIVFLPWIAFALFWVWGFASLYFSFRGESIGRSLSLGLANLHRYAAFTLAASAITGLGFVALSIPGAILVGSLEPIFGSQLQTLAIVPIVLLMTPGLYLMVAFAIGPFILLFDRKSIFAALKESFQRVSEYWLKTAIFLGTTLVGAGVTYSALKWLMFSLRNALGEIPWLDERFFVVFIYSMAWIIAASFFDLAVYKTYKGLSGSYQQSSPQSQESGSRGDRKDFRISPETLKVIAVIVLFAFAVNVLFVPAPAHAASAIIGAAIGFIVGQAALTVATTLGLTLLVSSTVLTTLTVIATVLGSINTIANVVSNLTCSGNLNLLSGACTPGGSNEVEIFTQRAVAIRTVILPQAPSPQEFLQNPSVAAPVAIEWQADAPPGNRQFLRVIDTATGQVYNDTWQPTPAGFSGPRRVMCTATTRQGGTRVYCPYASDVAVQTREVPEGDGVRIIEETVPIPGARGRVYQIAGGEVRDQNGELTGTSYGGTQIPCRSSDGQSTVLSNYCPPDAPAPAYDLCMAPGQPLPEEFPGQYSDTSPPISSVPEGADFSGLLNEGGYTPGPRIVTNAFTLEYGREYTFEIGYDHCISVYGGRYTGGVAPLCPGNGLPGNPGDIVMNRDEGCGCDSRFPESVCGTMARTTFRTPPIPPPSVNLQVNGSEGPVQLQTLDQPISLSWTSEYASECTASGEWSGALSPSGQQNETPLGGVREYGISCARPGAAPARDSVRVVYAPFGEDVPVVCGVQSQSRPYAPSQVTFGAVGGNNTYNWSAPGGDPSSGSGSAFTTRYDNPGTHTATVSSGPFTSACNVDVLMTAQGQLPPGTPPSGIPPPGTPPSGIPPPGDQPSPTLSTTLSASPSSGGAPLNGVDLTAAVSGTAAGTINYTFYCNRSDAGLNVTPGWAAKFDGVTANPQTAADACAYSSAGTYTAKVIVERENLASEARQPVTVLAGGGQPPGDQPPGGGGGGGPIINNFDSTEPSGPGDSVLLTWSVTGATSCTILNSVSGVTSAVPTSGDLDVTVTQETTFTLTCRDNQERSASAERTVSVRRPPGFKEIPPQ